MATVGKAGTSVWCSRKPKASRSVCPEHGRRDSSEYDCSRWRSSSADEDGAKAWSNCYTENRNIILLILIFWHSQTTN